VLWGDGGLLPLFQGEVTHETTPHLRGFDRHRGGDRGARRQRVSQSINPASVISKSEAKLNELVQRPRPDSPSEDRENKPCFDRGKPVPTQRPLIAKHRADKSADNHEARKIEKREGKEDVHVPHITLDPDLRDYIFAYTALTPGAPMSL
jgi:hypothetical protein